MLTSGNKSMNSEKRLFISNSWVTRSEWVNGLVHKCSASWAKWIRQAQTSLPTGMFKPNIVAKGELLNSTSHRLSVWFWNFKSKLF